MNKYTTKVVFLMNLIILIPDCHCKLLFLTGDTGIYPVNVRDLWSSVGGL